MPDRHAAALIHRIERALIEGAARSCRGAVVGGGVGRSGLLCRAVGVARSRGDACLAGGGGAFRSWHRIARYPRVVPPSGVRADGEHRGAVALRRGAMCHRSWRMPDWKQQPAMPVTPFSSRPPALATLRPSSWRTRWMTRQRRCCCISFAAQDWTGWRGMQPSAPFPGASDALPLLRPLLGVRSAETEALCRASGVAWVEDPANRDPAHQRTQVRHQLLPALAELNPRMVEALAGLATSAAVDRAALDWVASDALRRAMVEEDLQGGRVALSRRALRVALPAVRMRALRLAVEKVGGAKLSQERTEALAGLAERGRGLVECGGEVIATASGDALVIDRTNAGSGA